MQGLVQIHSPLHILDHLVDHKLQILPTVQSLRSKLLLGVGVCPVVHWWLAHHLSDGIDSKLHFEATHVRLKSSSLRCWCFPCRSFSDSCFLSSPLCSELADVQWYGHDKAKPGTLVWDLPKWAQQSTIKPSFRLSAVSDSPLTTDNLIHKAPQNPALSRAAGWKRALWRPALHPFHSDGPDELLLCSNTEPVLYSHSAHGNEAVEEMEWEGGEHTHSSGVILKFQSCEDVFHISSTPLPPCQMIPATFEPLLNTPVPYSHHFLFLIFICIFIKRVENKHRNDEIRSSQFNSQPKTTTGLTGHAWDSAPVENFVKSELWWEDIWDPGADYSNN